MAQAAPGTGAVRDAARAIPPPPPADSRRGAMALLVESAAPERRLLWTAVAGLAAAALLEALGPLLAKYFIDNVLRPRDAEPATIAGILIGAFAAGSVASLLRYAQLTRLARLAMNSVQRLRERVYGHVLRLPMSFFDREITGQLVSRVTNDTEAVKALYVQVLFVMLDSVIVLLGSLAAMAWLDWHLMLIVALLGPAVFAIVWLYQRWSAPAVARSRALRSELNAQMSESIAGMSVLQAANAAERFGGRFRATSEAHFQARCIELRANAWLLRPALDLLNVVLLAVVIAVFGLREFGGALSAIEVGVLYAFVAYIARVIEPLIQFTMQFSQLQQSVVAAARVRVLLLADEAPLPTAPARIDSGALLIERLSFGYAPGRDVLHEVSLELPSGSFVGIVGPTGSGKSTLLSLLLRFYPVDRGRITIDGVPLGQIGEAQFRRTVGVVPQEPFLLAASVRENIDMGRGLDDTAIEAAVRAADAHDFVASLPQGYATRLAEGGARLSTGQKQQLAIARALAGSPRVLFLDEATASIDSETERIVQRALTALRGRVTVVAIAHRLSTIRDADRIVVLNHGRVAESGRHDALMAIDGGIYRRLYELQQIARRNAGDEA